MRRPNVRWWGGGVAAILLLLTVAGGPNAQPSIGKLQIHFIDVGQADAVLIVDDTKHCVVVIDAGDTRYPDSSKNFRAYVQQHLPPGTEISLAIASHPHNDHIGSMRWIFESYQVKRYIDNGDAYPSQIYKTLMKNVKQKTALEYYPHTKVPSGKEAVCGAKGPKARVLYPKAGLDPNLCKKNANNCSVVVKLVFGTQSFLFPGDAEEEQEQLLLKDAAIRPQLAATLLKVPHHGSDTSSSQEFLDAVSPRVMVISAGHKGVGTNNGYKHPRLSTVQRLLTFSGPRDALRQIDVYDASNSQWKQASIWGGLHVTAGEGTIVFETDGSKVSKK